MAHVLDDPLPEGVYSPDLVAVVRYSRASTLMKSIDRFIWDGLADHFNVRQSLDIIQILDIIFLVGLDQIVSEFHAAVLTEVDTDTPEQVKVACRVPTALVEAGIDPLMANSVIA